MTLMIARLHNLGHPRVAVAHQSKRAQSDWWATACNPWVPKMGYIGIMRVTFPQKNQIKLDTAGRIATCNISV
jgi:hypothetical protein